jgi:hypothetical protein
LLCPFRAKGSWYSHLLSLAGLVGPLYPSKVCKKPFQSLLKAFERHLKHLGRAFLNAFERPLKKNSQWFFKGRKRQGIRAGQPGREGRD